MIKLTKIDMVRTLIDENNKFAREIANLKQENAALKQQIKEYDDANAKLREDYAKIKIEKEQSSE